VRAPLGVDSAAVGHLNKIILIFKNMKADVLQINWHDRKAVYSLDIQRGLQCCKPTRLATAGGDSTIRVQLGRYPN
jgi:hypothetical protein